MGKEIFINLEKEVFSGNVLDIGFENYGIVYDLCKNIDDDIAVDYVTEGNKEQKIQKDFYDSCIIFFSLSNMKNRKERKNIIKDVCEFIKKDGILYLWDIDKPRFKSKSIRLRIVVTNKKLKTMEVKVLNPFSDISYKVAIELLKPYFNVIDLKHSDDIYYIKAQKKLCSSIFIVIGLVLQF